MRHFLFLVVVVPATLIANALTPAPTRDSDPGTNREDNPMLIHMPGDIREQWQPGDTAVFHYSLDPNDAASDIAQRLGHRTGQAVTVLTEQDEDGNRAEFPTFDERADAGALVTYRVRFPDGHEDDAFEDELRVVAALAVSA